MSTINNVPFDINRTPTETNKVQPKRSAEPVYQTEASHKAPAHDPVGERRKRKERRKEAKFVPFDRRRLKQRRQTAKQQREENAAKKKPKGPGQFIDFKV